MRHHSTVRSLAKFFFISIALMFLAGGNYAEERDQDIFPVYKSIEPNVLFWKKIYSEFHTRQGVIHDAEKLHIVYEIVNLKSSSKRGSRRYNRNLLKKTKSKYRKILEKLAKGKAPVSEEEIRVASLFGANPDPLVLVEAMDNIRFQRGQADRFKNGVIRSGRYLPRIVEIFKSYELPTDLCYLPHVESSFNYKAYSKFGAAGIWQFTYGTGKRYMKINYTVDERRDPILASHAAAKLLKSNYEKLGSWALAITAYNHGVNSMLRAKKQKGDYETIVNEYDGRRFKFASKNFYSEFLAAKEVAKNYQKYFGELTLHKEVPVYEIKMAGYVPVKKIASHFSVSTKTIQNLNPALRRPVFLGQKYIPKNYQLRLPENGSTSSLASKIPKDVFLPKQKRSQFYHVRKGDVAGAIARRHGITLKELIWANNLNHRATIYVGQNLRIPSNEDSKKYEEKYKKAQEIARLDREKREKNNVAYSFPSIEKDENGEMKLVNGVNLSVVSGDLEVKRVYKRGNNTYGHIRVDTGETLGHYAEWLEVSTQSIRNLNGLRFGRGIDFNDRITIPLYRVSKEQFEEKRYEYHKEFEEDFLSAFEIDSVTIYEIKRGDNIWTLCQEQFDLPFWLIRKYNPNLDFYRLKPFQKLVVPVVEKRS